MSHFEDDKYRFRILLPESLSGHKLKTEARTRLGTIKRIAGCLKRGMRVSNKIKFCQRDISSTHREKLLKCAVFWNDIQRMEEEVKNRSPKKNI